MSFRDAFNRRRIPGYAGGTLEEQLLRDALLQSPNDQILTERNREAITRPRTVTPVPEEVIAPPVAQPSFKARFARPQQEEFGSSGEPFGARPRRTQPRDTISDDAQYLRDLRSQPRTKKDIAMGVIDAVSQGFGNKPRTTMTKRERQIAETEERLGTELTVGQKQNAIQAGQMVPVTLEDGSVVEVPARSAGNLQSQQQRIRQLADQALERKRVNSARIDRWERMESRDRKRLLADLYKSGGTNDPEQLEYIADQLGIPGALRPKFIQGQMRDAVDEDGNLIQVNRQTQEVLSTGEKSYETTKEAGRDRRFAQGQAGANTRAGMRSSGTGTSTDKTAMRKTASLVAQIDRARNEMESADKSGDKTKREQARIFGEQAASELNALGVGYEAGRGEGGYPYYKRVAGQAAPASRAGKLNEATVRQAAIDAGLDPDEAVRRARAKGRL